MSKQFTVVFPMPVPVELAKKMKDMPPPYAKGVMSEKYGEHGAEMQVDFEIPPDCPPEEEEDFKLAAKKTLAIAVAMVGVMIPRMLDGVIHDLITKRHKDWIGKNPLDFEDDKKAGKLREWYLHQVAVWMGDLVGEDHRPCWEAGKCLHEEADKKKREAGNG